MALSLFYDEYQNLISLFVLYLETFCSSLCINSNQVSKFFIFMLLCLEQYMDRSTVMEHMTTHPVGSLRWNQRTAQASYTDVLFSLAAQLWIPWNSETSFREWPQNIMEILTISFPRTATTLLMILAPDWQENQFLVGLIDLQG